MSRISATTTTKKTLCTAAHLPLGKCVRLCRGDASVSAMTQMGRIQGGFALIAEIFVLVLVAALAVAGLSMAVSQQTSVEQDARAIEAELAAQAGLEWGIFQVLTPASTAVSAPLAASATGVVPMSGVLADFSVQVNAVRASQPVATASGVTSGGPCATAAASAAIAASSVCWTYTLDVAASSVLAGAGIASAPSVTVSPGQAGFAERRMRATVERVETQP